MPPTSGSHLGAILPSMGHVTMSRDILVVTTGMVAAGGGGAISIYWAEARNSAKHPTILGQPQ